MFNKAASAFLEKQNQEREEDENVEETHDESLIPSLQNLAFDQHSEILLNLLKNSFEENNWQGKLQLDICICVLISYSSELEKLFGSLSSLETFMRIIRKAFFHSVKQKFLQLINQYEKKQKKVERE